MADLNTMMREQAVAGLNAQLDAAVTEGDTEKVRKITGDIASLAVQMAPKPPPFGQADITAELDKHAWFGTDPRKSAKAVELGKTLDPKKFATAAAFTEALVKAVEEDMKPPGAASANDDDEEDEEEDDEAKKAAVAAGKKPRRSDGPGEGDATQRTSTRRTAGPWTKLADAPPDVRKEIERSADRFVSSNAPKEQRAAYEKRALESHYAIHQRNRGK